jgi:hypothetical protein
MIGWLMNNHLERIWKEVVMAYLKVLSWHLPGGTEENHEKCVRMANIQAEILTQNLSNMKQEC